MNANSAARLNRDLPAPSGGWERHAACRNVDPDLFFPVSEVGHNFVWDEPRAVCAGCPVQTDCLMWALTNGERYGMFGGMSPEERDRWAKERGVPRHGTVPGYKRDGCRCDRCLKANSEDVERRRGRTVSPCGTDAGYKRHKRRGEDCARCRAAHARSKAEGKYGAGDERKSA